MDEQDLLRAYAERADEGAFTELVRRHGDWVYSAARRQLGDVHLAEDVTQAVFLMLARKARSLVGYGYSGGWLLHAARYCAKEAKRDRARVARREKEAAGMRKEAVEEAGWEEVAPELDAAVGKLGKSDREAVLLRFYEERPLVEVGRAMGISEEAARKRVDRAVGKLRGLLAKKGISGTTAGLSAVLVGNVVERMPEHLVEKIVLAVGGGGGSAVAAGIAKGAMKMMTMAKVKMAAVVLGLVVAGGVIYAATGPAGAKNSPEQRDASPAKVASAQADNLGFGATLPNGLRLEVVGVSYSPSAGREWWKPDGSPLPDRPYDVMPNARVSGGMVSRDIAVRIANQPADPATVAWTLGQGGARGTLVGPQSPDIQGMAVAWPDGAKTTSVTFNAATGPWETVHVDQSGGTTSATSEANGPSFIIHRPRGTGGPAQITVVDNQIALDVRIIAVDAQGGEHVAQRSGCSAGVMRLSIAQFSDIAASEITEVRIQTRPFDYTVRVDNISLNPGQMTQVKVEVKELPAPAPTGTSTTQQGLGGT